MTNRTSGLLMPAGKSGIISQFFKAVSEASHYDLSSLLPQKLVSGLKTKINERWQED